MDVAKPAADTNVHLLYLSRETLESVLGDLGKLAHQWRLAALQRVRALDVLSEQDLIEAADKLESRVLGDGEMIHKEGEVVDAFYIIENGMVTVHEKGDTVETLGRGAYFGDTALFKGRGAKSSKTVLTNGSTVVWVMSGADFLNKLSAAKDKLTVVDNIPKINVFNLDRLQMLGVGNFGKVRGVDSTISPYLAAPPPVFSLYTDQNFVCGVKKGLIV